MTSRKVQSLPLIDLNELLHGIPSPADASSLCSNIERSHQNGAGRQHQQAAVKPQQYCSFAQEVNDVAGGRHEDDSSETTVQGLTSTLSTKQEEESIKKEEENIVTPVKETRQHYTSNVKQEESKKTRPANDGNGQCNPLLRKKAKSRPSDKPTAKMKVTTTKRERESMKQEEQNTVMPAKESSQSSSPTAKREESKKRPPDDANGQLSPMRKSKSKRPSDKAAAKMKVTTTKRERERMKQEEQNTVMPAKESSQRYSSTVKQEESKKMHTNDGNGQWKRLRKKAKRRSDKPAGKTKVNISNKAHQAHSEASEPPFQSSATSLEEAKKRPAASDGDGHLKRLRKKAKRRSDKSAASIQSNRNEAHQGRPNAMEPPSRPAVALLDRSSVADDEDEVPETPSNQWDSQYEKLLTFYQQHKHSNVTRSENVSLSKWICKQRRIKKDGKLDREQIRKLNTVEFEWNSKRTLDDFAWKRRFERLQAYQEKYGNANVPQSYPPDQDLGTWVANQRRRHNKHTLRQDRVTLMESLNFSWLVKDGRKKHPISTDFYDAQWEATFQRLVAYKSKHGHTNVGSSEHDLKMWVSSQRRSFHKKTWIPGRGIRLDRKEKLDSIGFEWSRSKRRNQVHSGRDEEETESEDSS